MIFYVSGRQLGKTEQMIRWWLTDPEHQVIYASNQDRRRQIQRRAAALVRQYWKDGQMILITENIRVFPFQIGGRSLNGMPYAIDDIEDVFAQYMGRKPDFVTATAQLIGEADKDG